MQASAKGSSLPSSVWVGWANGVLVALVALGVWVHAHRDLPEVFWTGDETEYADIGRNLSRGEGFVSRSIYPSQARWGLDAQHPSLVRAPLWPIAIAGTFALTGVGEAPVFAATAVCFAVTALLAYGIATALAGPWIGLIAGVAVATAPDFLVYALFALSETPFALCVTAVFLLVATRRDPFWIGLACGAAYLTRFNGGLLLLVAVLPFFRRPFSLAPFVRCGIGFALVAVPWWARNFLVTGQPFYSLYGITLYFTPEAIPANGSLNHMLVPDFDSAAAMDPWKKFWIQLPDALLHGPLATANALALAGVFLGAWRRDRLCGSLLLVTGLTTLLICLMLVRGRYLVPFVPVAIALGCVAWHRYGGRLRIPALACILLAPLLPEIPDLLDTRLMHGMAAKVREDTRGGRSDWTGFAEAMKPCVEEDPLVMAQNASTVAWIADTVTVYMTATEADFWTLVDAHPIEIVRFEPAHKLQRQLRFLKRFEPAPQCGAGVYRRRKETQG